MKDGLQLSQTPDEVESGSSDAAERCVPEPGSQQYLSTYESTAAHASTPDPVNEWDTTYLTVVGPVRIPFGEAILFFGEFLPAQIVWHNLQLAATSATNATRQTLTVIFGNAKPA